MSTLTTPDRTTSTNGYGPAGPNGHNGHGSGGSSRKSTGKNRTLTLVVGLAAILGVAALAGGYYAMNRPASTASDLLTFEVKRGPLVVNVTESGTIKAATQAVIKSEVEGRVSILQIVPEGQQVKKGDLLVELDTTGMVDEKLEREIRVQNAEAAFVQAQENLAVVQNQAEADISAAELEYQFALEDLRKYEEGDYVQQLMEAQSKIAIAEEELERAQNKAEGSQKLLDQNFISQTEFQADQLAAQKAALDLQLARGALELLEKWERKRQLDEFNANVEQTRMALERAKRKASADVVQAEADLRAKKAEFDQQTDRLARDIAQIEKGKIYAPTDGLVVYATSAEGGWRGNEEPLEAGQEVRERQDLIYLPTPEDRIAEIKVHESSLDKIHVGLPARVTIDALPGRQYWGTVTKVSPLPDATTAWLNPDLKVYATEILIPGLNTELRTGMSCRAEIIVETFEDAVYVPVQSVVRINGVPTVFVIRPGQAPEQREVEIGLDNNRMVVIKSGLEAGEQVLLAPPLGDTSSADTLRREDLPEDKIEQADEARENNPPARDANAEPGAEAGPGAGPGGPGAGRGGRGGAGQQAMTRVTQQLQAKATAEELQKLQEYRESRDFPGMAAYSRELAQKYEITLPSPAGQGGPGGPGGSADGQGQSRDQAGGASDSPQGEQPAESDAESEAGADAGDEADSTAEPIQEVAK